MVGSDEFPFGVRVIFSGAFAVSFREGKCGKCVCVFLWLAGVCWLELGFSTVLQSKIYQLV